MRASLRAALVALLCAVAPAWVATSAAARSAAARSAAATPAVAAAGGAGSEVAEAAADPPGAPVAVIAHRGAHRSFPENTLAALQAAIDMGADFAELDVRTSADGELVVMHDRTVQRTTTGRGAVASLTLGQLRALDAGVKFAPGFIGTRVPTFDEALAMARGRIGIYVDAKRVRAEPLLAALQRHAMEEHVVVYGRFALLRDIARREPRVRVMPEAWTAWNLRCVLARLPVRVVAYNDWDFRQRVIDVARARSADVYVDRLGPRDNPDGWEQAIQRGATGIQTNRPQELIEYLERSGRRARPAPLETPGAQASGAPSHPAGTESAPAPAPDQGGESQAPERLTSP